MHNNFYFLRQLSKQLASVLTGAVVSECFSQAKDELILRFETLNAPFFIKASLLPELSCLSFPENFQRARKNSVDLFPGIIGTRVSGVRQFNNERSFAISLSTGYDLLFKMHGNRTNLVLFQNGNVTELFRNKITADNNLRLEALDREIDWSYAYFLENAQNLKAAYFTFGKIVWEYLYRKGFPERNPSDQWEAVLQVKQMLEEPEYRIICLQEKPILSLLPLGEILQTPGRPLEAANAYYHAFIHDYAFSREKNALLNVLRSKLAAGASYCKKNKEKLSAIQHEDHYRIWADLVMANMHAIPPGAEKVTVQNFYADNHPMEIRLKKDLTPQKNAELFYRKAKNQHIQVERLESAIHQKREEMEDLGEKIREVESASDVKTIRLVKSRMNDGGEKSDAPPLPYHEFQLKGYRIWVGKNAQGNDILTFKHGYKEDLWLHAKDVSGSHVLIKYQAGKNFPKEVIEFAASLAAYNSKRKNESLCPVIVTPRKFVRKRKGDPPGAVVVEQEKVLLADRISF